MQIQIPGYDIKEEIGKGGSSEVYKAIRESDGLVVAVKVLHEKYSQDKGMRERLLREAQVIGGLDHKNVVRIYHREFRDKRIYMVLQYLNQGSLSAYKELSNRDLLKTMIQVCDGVGYIHSNHIVHRDLKPSNIMFGEDGIPRLVDFGISLFSDADYTRLTHTNMVMGTLSYMSPEQQTSPADVDIRTDIYSLGAIMYEIFTHRKPVGRFQNPCDLHPNFDPRLEAIILKAMKHNKEDRYHDAMALGRELAELWKEGLFIEEQTPEDPFDERIGRWISDLGASSSLKERLKANEMLVNNVRPGDVPRLVNICTSSDKMIRKAIIPILGKLRDKRAQSFLISQMGDAILCKDVCYALASIGGTESVKSMAQLVKKHEVFSYYALVPLAILSGDQHIKLILPYLKSPSYAERGEALKALDRAATRRYLKDIKKYLKTETQKDLINLGYNLVQRLELS